MALADLFFNDFIHEAALGRVDCYFIYNILFETYIVEDNTLVSENVSEDNIIIPRLTIKNKDNFLNLLSKYLDLASKFYDDNNFPEEQKPYKLKTLLALLWSNATFEDFSNPEIFLRRRIDFFNNELKNHYEFGWAELLRGNLCLDVCKDSVYNETPFKLVVYLDNGEEKYYFPEVKMGISSSTAYFYAMQNNIKNNNSYSKKVNRALYKIGAGFDSTLDNESIYGDGNLANVSASFLVCLNIVLNYLQNLGINKICANSILLPRWNAKRMAINYKFKMGKINDIEKEKLIQEQIHIQNNLTQKFIRTFLRLNYHYEGISLTAYPLQIDSNLHLDIQNMQNSNNYLLQELANLVKKDNFTR